VGEWANVNGLKRLEIYSRATESFLDQSDDARPRVRVKGCDKCYFTIKIHERRCISGNNLELPDEKVQHSFNGQGQSDVINSDQVRARSSSISELAHQIRKLLETKTIGRADALRSLCRHALAAAIAGVHVRGVAFSHFDVGLASWTSATISVSVTVQNIFWPQYLLDWGKRVRCN